MRQCPRCYRAYSDQTLIYCLDDGSALVPDTPLQRPVARPTTPLATEFLPAAQPPLPRQRKRPWLVYSAVALASAGLIVWVVLFLASRDGDTRPRQAVASPTPEATAGPHRGDAPGSTEIGPGKTGQGKNGKGDTETPQTTGAGAPSPLPSPSPAPVTQSPSWRLVGVWRADLSAGGRPIELTYTFNADGTCKFVAKDRQGRRATGQGTWQYSEGMLYQTFANGASGKGSIEWIDDDTFEVTIIDNGVPADSGQKRRYYRLS
jgi:hypothetical protein